MGRSEEVGSRKSEVGSRKSEVGSRKSEVGSRKKLADQITNFLRAKTTAKASVCLRFGVKIKMLNHLLSVTNNLNVVLVVQL